jgi:hypothetical protein
MTLFIRQMFNIQTNVALRNLYMLNNIQSLYANVKKTKLQRQCLNCIICQLRIKYRDLHVESDTVDASFDERRK